MFHVTNHEISSMIVGFLVMITLMTVVFFLGLGNLLKGGIMAGVQGFLTMLSISAVGYATYSGFVRLANNHLHDLVLMIMMLTRVVVKLRR